MGCCVSTHNATAGTPHRHRHPFSPPSKHHVSKSPPTAEEEAVKEVLSETTHKPSKTASPNPYYYTPVPKISHRVAATNSFPTAVLAADHKLLRSPRKQPASLKYPPAPDEISKVSEISCLNDSVSAPTAAEADGEVRQRVPRTPSPGRTHKPGSFSADPAVRRERLNGKSPVRRSDLSPRRTGPGRESGQAGGRNSGGGFGIGDGQRRRDPGENSGRRSRSPVTRNDVVVNRSNAGRSPSGRRTRLSPGRVRMVQPGIGGGDDGARRREQSGGEKENNWEKDPTTPSESLEGAFGD